MDANFSSRRMVNHKTRRIPSYADRDDDISDPDSCFASADVRNKLTHVVKVLLRLSS